MSLLQRGLTFVLAAATIAIPSSVPPESRAGGRTAAPVDPQTVSIYTPADKEYYLTEAQVDFIRPGLKVTLGAVTDMAPGKKPSVELTMTDDLNQPLDRTGGTTPGVVSMRFIPAVFDPATNYYHNILPTTGNPTRDTAGTWTEISLGKYTYKFAAKMVDFDVNKPVTLIVGGNRNMVDTTGRRTTSTCSRTSSPRRTPRRRRGTSWDGQVRAATTRWWATARTTARSRPASSATTATT